MKPKILVVSDTYHPQVDGTVGFIDEFLTEEFCRENKLFTFGLNQRTNNWEIQSKEFKEIKQKLLFQLTNIGNPIIEVVDGNYDNRGELLLMHSYEGRDIQHNWAHDTLKNLYHIWKRPTNLETKVNGKRLLLTYDGKESKQKKLN